MPCCSLTPRGKTDPLVDVDQVLKEFAWDRLAEKTWWDKRCKERLYKLEVNWNYLNVSHRLLEFSRRREGQDPEDKKPNKPPSKVIARDICLFRTEFTNNSDSEQTFTFKTERQTKSSCSVSVQKGWRIGANLNIRLSVPVPQKTDQAGNIQTLNLEPCGVTGGLSGHLDVRKTKGEKFEETLTWGCDSQVSVPKKTRVVASLLVREEEFMADFVLESTIRATHASIPVHQTSRKDDKLVEILEIESNNLVLIFQEKEGFSRDSFEGPQVVRCRTRGIYEAVYAAEQVIDIQSYPITEEISPVDVSTAGTSGPVVEEAE